MKHARIEHAGQVLGGTLEGETFRAAGVELPVGDVDRWLAPVTPGKILATHLTFRSRVEEYRMAQPPREPSYFMKPPSSLSGHLAPVVRPAGCRFLNYEGEVAVVIGRRCHGVSLGEALDHVAGYTIANDWGVHDFRHADRGSMLRVKGQDGFCPLGPAMVDAADVDPDDLTIRTFVNGEQVQYGHTGSDLMFSFAYQIADLARLITLEPGDILLTGTPANSRPVQPGDLVAVQVDGIGRLENRVLASDQPLLDIGEQPVVTAQTLHVALAVPEDEALDSLEAARAVTQNSQTIGGIDDSP
jgi:5-oxopent-3-ene-1,2,5-tricarboxylate decarboxylase/2-hydroxyhepta-2,4-diene-1,7-dioate isomerase